MEFMKQDDTSMEGAGTRGKEQQFSKSLDFMLVDQNNYIQTTNNDLQLSSPSQEKNLEEAVSVRAQKEAIKRSEAGCDLHIVHDQSDKGQFSHTEGFQDVRAWLATNQPCNEDDNINQAQIATPDNNLQQAYGDDYYYPQYEPLNYAKDRYDYYEGCFKGRVEAKGLRPNPLKACPTGSFIKVKVPGEASSVPVIPSLFNPQRAKLLPGRLRLVENAYQEMLTRRNVSGAPVSPEVETDGHENTPTTQEQNDQVPRPDTPTPLENDCREQASDICQQDRSYQFQRSWAEEEDEEDQDLVARAQEAFAKIDAKRNGISSEKCRRDSILSFDYALDAESKPASSLQENNDLLSTSIGNQIAMPQKDETDPASAEADAESMSSYAVGSPDTKSTDFGDGEPAGEPQNIDIRELETVTGMSHDAGLKADSAWNEKIQSPSTESFEKLEMQRSAMAWETEKENRSREAHNIPTLRVLKLQVDLETQLQHVKGLAHRYLFEKHQLDRRLRDAHLATATANQELYTADNQYQQLRGQYNTLLDEYNYIQSDFAPLKQRVMDLEQNDRSLRRSLEQEKEKFEALQKLYDDLHSKGSNCGDTSDRNESVDSGYAEESLSEDWSTEESVSSLDEQPVEIAGVDSKPKETRDVDNLKEHPKTPLTTQAPTQDDRSSDTGAGGQRCHSPFTSGIHARKSILWDIAPNIREALIEELAAQMNRRFSRDQGILPADSGGVLEESHVDSMLAHGDGTFDGFVRALQEAGYDFRPEHLACDLQKWYRDREMSVPTAVMFWARRLDERLNPVERLLEEIRDLQEETLARRREAGSAKSGWGYTEQNTAEDPSTVQAPANGDQTQPRAITSSVPLNKPKLSDISHGQTTDQSCGATLALQRPDIFRQQISLAALNRPPHWTARETRWAQTDKFKMALRKYRERMKLTGG